MNAISTSEPLTGFFSIDDTVGNKTAVVLRSPKEGSFVITLTNPSGEQLILENEPEVTNWNSPDSNIGVISKSIPNLAVSVE